MFLKAVFLPDESGGDPTFVNSFEFVTLANFGGFLNMSYDVGFFWLT